MKPLALALLAVSAACAATDPRLTVHTLVREDIFAGFLNKDMDRFTRGEATLEALLTERPADRHLVRVWQGGAAVNRAVLAAEAGDRAAADRWYQTAVERFAEAEKLGPRDGGVFAVIGGSYVLFADRLPAEHRAAAWQKAYESFSKLAMGQMAMVEQMPLHLKGELLSGLAMSAQRTGRTAEYEQALTKMLTLLKDTPYEPVAKAWKEKPEVAGKTSIVCKTCHDPGRLEPTKARLAKQP